MSALKTHQVFEGHDQARCARHQARLTLIRGRGSTTLPRRDRGYQARPAAIASPMAVGRCCLFSEAICSTETQSIEMASELHEFPFIAGTVRTRCGRAERSKTGCTWGYQQSARRSCCCRSRSRPARAATRQKHHLYRRSRRRQPAISQQLPRRIAGVHEDLSQQSASACTMPRWPSRCSAPSAGGLRYVSCLRFAPRESDGSYREVRERAVLYVDGRLDRVVENASDMLRRRGLCAVPGVGKADALVSDCCRRASCETQPSTSLQTS